RFEKGVDPNRVERAGRRACRLLHEYAGGNVLSGVETFDKLDRSEKVIDVQTSVINKRLGTNITSDEIGEILRKLRFAYEREADQFRVSIPTRRGDIAIFEDISSTCWNGYSKLIRFSSIHSNTSRRYCYF